MKSTKTRYYGRTSGSSRIRASISVLILALICCCNLHAETPPRGFSATVFGEGIFPIDEYATYTTVNAGGGLSFEYTIPHELGLFSYGIVAQGLYDFAFIPADSPLASVHTVSPSAGMFGLFSFRAGTIRLSIHPQVTYGVIFSFIKAKDGATLRDVYVNQVAEASLGFRFSLPKGAWDFELELSPVYRMIINQNDLLHQLGARLGFVWHISDFYWRVR